MVEDPISTFSYDFNSTFMTPFLNLTSPSIDMLIISGGENGNLLKMRIRGSLQALVEPERYMYLTSYFKFFDEDTEHFQVDAESNAAYENLYSLDHLFDIIDSNFTGTANFEGNILRYNMTSMSVLGRDCYSNREVLDALTHQNDNTVGDNVYDYNDNLEDFTNFIHTENCVVGRTNLHLQDDPMENSFYSYYNIESVSRLMNTVMNSFDGEFLPGVIQEVDMRSGITLSVNYADVDPTEANLDRELNFIGVMNWYGLQKRGNINCHIDQNYANLTMNLTSFSIGSGNLQFMTLNDIGTFLNLSSGADTVWEINGFQDGNNVTEDPNTLNAGMVGSNLQDTTVYLSTNVMIFDMFRRISVPISDELISFEIIGMPFNGIFNAQTTISFIPEENLENESNSVVLISLIDDNRIGDVSERANLIIMGWVNQIINSFGDMANKLAELNENIENLNLQYTSEENCPEITRCTSAPILTCTSFNTEAQCLASRLV